MHGVGIPTERGYRYRYQQGGGQPGVWRLNETDGEEGGPVVVTDGACVCAFAMLLCCDEHPSFSSRPSFCHHPKTNTPENALT